MERGQQLGNYITTQKRRATSKKVHANRTAEEKARISKKISEGVKKWHAEMSKEKKQAIKRKMSKTQQQRKSEVPPRMKKDTNKKKSVAFKKFDKSPAGREQRKYLGYLSSMDILQCEPNKKSRIIAKRAKGHKKNWDSLSPEERALRISKTLGMTKIKERMKKKELFFERDVPREKNFCGVVTIEEMEKMYA